MQNYNIYDRKSLKQSAKDLIRNKWFSIFIALLIIAVVGSIVTVLTSAILFVFAAIVSLIISCIMNLSALNFIIHFIKTSETDYNKLYKYNVDFNGLIRLFGVYILTAIFTLLWSLLFIIPGIIKSYAYRYALVIAMEEPDLSVTQCITKSQELMHGYKFEAFVFDLSFIGWGLLTALTFGILSIWVAPYYLTSFMLFYYTVKDIQFPAPAPEEKDEDNIVFDENNNNIIIS